MRGHGFTAVGVGVREAVFRAIYTQKNARVQTKALAMRDAYLSVEERGKKGEEKGSEKDMGPQFLSEMEIGGCTEMGRETAGRPWGLWVREVERCGVYDHER